MFCISMSNFAPRVFTRLSIASDQFGTFSNAVGWIHSLRLSWQFFSTRLLNAPSGMLVELSSASLRSVVAASALSFWMNSDSAVDVRL